MPSVPPYEIRWADPNCFSPREVEFDLYDLEYGEYYQRLVAMFQATFLGQRIEENLLNIMRAWVEHQLYGYIQQGVLFEIAPDFWEWDLRGTENDRTRA